eukprot:XP_027310513.1 very large A-kinase anchor protein-like [Anas platyrhynchos]
MSGGGSRRRAGPSWHGAFSRFFARSPPRQEAAAPGRPAGAHSSEHKGSEAINLKNNQKESTTLPALLKVCQNEEKNHSTEELNKSETQEELKKANSLPSLTPGIKTADKDKQPREGFFQFLGSLFNLTTKSSLVESKQSTFQDEPNRCEKDLQNTNTPMEDMHPQHQKTEEPCNRSGFGVICHKGLIPHTCVFTVVGVASSIREVASLGSCFKQVVGLLECKVILVTYSQ